MGWITIAGAVFQIILLWLKNYYEKDQEKRNARNELKTEFKETLAKRDYAHLGLLFDRARKLR